LYKDRPAEAWKVVSKLHGNNEEGDDSAIASFAREEFYQMTHQVQADKAMAAGESLMTLFKKPSYRKRMICAFLTMFGAESTGILVIYSMIPFTSYPLPMARFAFANAHPQITPFCSIRVLDSRAAFHSSWQPRTSLLPVLATISTR
jgi:hypothetical protein